MECYIGHALQNDEIDGSIKNLKFGQNDRKVSS